MSGASSRRRGYNFENQMRTHVSEDTPLHVLTYSHVGSEEEDAVLQFRGSDWDTHLVTEFKNQKSTDLSGWWRQTVEQCERWLEENYDRLLPEERDQVLPLLIHKRRGKAAGGDQWVTMTVDTLVKLVEISGK